MKRVGVVTWYGASPKGFNFGTCLQSYALQKTLCDLGYDARMVSFGPRPKESVLKRLLSRVGLLQALRAMRRFAKTGRFLEDDFVRRIRKWNRAHYSEMGTEGADCFVSGSDQIWNTYHCFDPRYFLDFAADAKRVSYASSIGTKGVNPKYADEVVRLLSGFAHITMREEMGADAMRKLTGRSDISRVQDPTLLMTVGDWRSFGREERLHKKIKPGYMLCYLLSKKSVYAEQLKKVVESLGITNVVLVPSLENRELSVPGAVRYEDATPSEFVRLIDEAEYVCTDSFHATALSLLLSKRFVEFLRFDDSDAGSQNSRIYEILGRYGLADRLFERGGDGWQHDIDYGRVQEMLSADRAESLEKLRQMIEN